MSPRANKLHYQHAINALVDGLRRYADAYREDFDAPVGEDAFLGEAWSNIASNVIMLLNGECGDIDRGKLDSEIRALASGNGVDVEL